MDPIYDKIGINYSVRRETDPKIAKQLYAELQGATRIVNIGAGTGSYEPENVELVSVEPSAEMISQRKSGSYRVEQAFAEKLPFENSSFSHAMTVLSMHHWENRALAFSEINRVATEKFVAITWDPKSEPFWLDFYLSESIETFSPPPPFTLSEFEAGLLPERVYTKAELQSYLQYGRHKCKRTIDNLTDALAPQRCRSDWPEMSVAELLLYNMRHVQEHAAQLSLFLGQQEHSASAWVPKARSNNNSA
jgi:SAM-dependent methyltransferase